MAAIFDALGGVVLAEEVCSLGGKFHGPDSGSGGGFRGFGAKCCGAERTVSFANQAIELC